MHLIILEWCLFYDISWINDTNFETGRQTKLTRLSALKMYDTLGRDDGYVSSPFAVSALHGGMNFVPANVFWNKTTAFMMSFSCNTSVHVIIW